MSDEQTRTELNAAPVEHNPAAKTSTIMQGHEDLVRLYKKYSEPLQVMERLKRENERTSFSATSILAGVSR